MNESYMCCWIYYYYLIFFSTESIILFLAAGNNTGDDPLDVIKSENEARNNTVTILTYSFGQGRLLIQKGWKKCSSLHTDFNVNVNNKRQITFYFIVRYEFLLERWFEEYEQTSKKWQEVRTYSGISFSSVSLPII